MVRIEEINEGTMGVCVVCGMRNVRVGESNVRVVCGVR